MKHRWLCSERERGRGKRDVFFIFIYRVWVTFMAIGNEKGPIRQVADTLNSINTVLCIKLLILLIHNLITELRELTISNWEQLLSQSKWLYKSTMYMYTL